ncbi:uncharacterized protein NECHADRAFT_85137 [Fusarium vanettenii 77-13-4]|uniref:Uncharacterized protein n=1 Tax=Fusarium vanettenii (strain ATCC MYA-4622 / CBS 123669 / FGSC 9596 / NRRL 45880 / 77-13-4) TaxID=660122 RepID=C7YV35_FUSV7|nr:uncharacterized protein NECHADRAFT_85137 [Fusarium vanettenii 77-13-4]EEU44916.1 predicted protein [Fusarium vanettenii 77-13-4]
MSRIQYRSSLSRALETLSGLATRIHCVEDKDFDAELVAFLVPHLNDDNARRRLLSFLDHNNGMWACLASICAEGYGVRKGTVGGCECPYHGNPRVIFIIGHGRQQLPLMKTWVGVMAPAWGKRQSWGRGSKI